MAKRISVVVSQGHSSNPAKRQLEEDIVAGLMFEAGIDVTVIPHLYDLKADSTGMLALSSISGDLIIVSWMFERAAHWILDRNKISGHVGTTLLVNDDEEEDEEEEEIEEANEKPRVIEHRQIPDRRIYCLDLKISNDASVYIEEAKRIFAELRVPVVSIGLNGTKKTPTADQKERFENPVNTTSLSIDGSGKLETNGRSPENEQASVNQDSAAIENGVEKSAANAVNRIDEKSPRRWYPVIDYSRCTNCLECIDFCLFGVYGVDRIDTILVEQPDNCRKGCPACSRVCPENAIIFPQHKTPAIAGSAELGSSLKIDLSQLFGAPDDGKSAEELAALERDEQLVMAGRDAVGMQGLQKRRNSSSSTGARDEIDDLADQLDDFD